MLKIAVRVPRRFESVGEYLADARALDAVGVDSLWLEAGGDDPWILLASIAAVTGRIRLVVPVTADDRRTPAVLETRLTTLGRLSRGRAVVDLTPEPTAAHGGDDLVTLARRCACPVILGATDRDRAHVAAVQADELVGLDESPGQLRGALESVHRARASAGLTAPLGVWVRTTMPKDRAEWRSVRDAFAGAGATGLIVPADPRLLDLLRNGDEEDDRSDLALAQG
jgi:alkanesulfonate monooxygenase SsuD/methylene tetrahydromethanopterin reductase-like flavin-dependent oxidoreductase (luciferase family)